MRAFLEQRDHLDALRTEIAETEAENEQLLRERRRWDDEEYQRQQARQRLGYVDPGEISFQALDEDLQPLDSPDTLSDPADPGSTPDPWMENLWESVEYAGDPPDPEDEPKPAEHIEAPKE